MSWTLEATKFAAENIVDHYEVMLIAQSIIDDSGKKSGNELFAVQNTIFSVRWAENVCPCIDA